MKVTPSFVEFGLRHGINILIEINLSKQDFIWWLNKFLFVESRVRAEDRKREDNLLASKTEV